MLSTIFVPMDGSDLSERALPYAARLAKLANGRIILMRALGADQDGHGAQAPLDAAAARLRADGLSVETFVYSQAHERVSQVIADIASSHGAELLAMSTHGRGGLGRFLFGSVADEVLRDTELPVLLVSAACDHRWPPDRPLRILLPMDESDLSVKALRAVAELTNEVSAELTLLHVLDSADYPYLYSDPATWRSSVPEEREAIQRLEAIADPLRAEGRAVATRVLVGSPATTIAQAARELDTDLIAMPTHGRAGLSRVVMGSVATGTLHRAHVPLLVFRAGTLESLGVAAESPTATPPVPMI
ncbi:MAG: universal stress protein [Chloroflexi bacterium]|nr:universal stress protein [Chloroflexota bacterium]